MASGQRSAATIQNSLCLRQWLGKVKLRVRGARLERVRWAEFGAELAPSIKLLAGGWCDPAAAWDIFPAFAHPCPVGDPEFP